MFYAIGNVGDSKKTDDTRVNNKRDPKEHVVEITDADKPLSAFPTGKENNAVCSPSEWKAGNTAYDILYSNEYVYDEEGKFESFGGKTYEFRYEMKNITDEQRQVNIDTWRNLYTFIVTSSDEEFYANLKNYFVVDSALYFYLFTERYTMVDNRAKNSFWHYGKVYISNEEAATLGETEASYYIIDDAMAAINDGYRYDLTFGYDFDTCLGIDNTGDYVFSYGKEDIDYYKDGDPTSGYVFRVADSVFFCRLRDLFPAELQSMFKSREDKNAWSANSLITQWDNCQAQFPEELWRLDYQRKYYRTYLGASIDNSITESEDRMSRGVDPDFLTKKFFGRKKYSRRAFEINNEVYFATKYFGQRALSDVFWIRGNTPIGGKYKPNYSLTLVPYSDMYVCVQYTSTGTPIHKKVKAGQTVVFENDATTMDFIYVYAASFIQEVGDLSRCFVGDNSFTGATRLQRLTIGSTDEGYENTFMTGVSVANNPLLEYLDLRNVSGINTIIDVSSCGNLKELYAEGTNASGAIFAKGGLLETAHLPNIGSLSIKNLSYLKDLSIDGYDNLHTLIVENTAGIDTYEMVANSPALRFVRLINVLWAPNDTSMLTRLLDVDGYDASGHETDLAVLTGTARVPVIGQLEWQKYQQAWPGLQIIPTTVIPQFNVTFVNHDGTVLDVQPVNQFGNAVDPITREEDPIPVPTKESTIEHDFTFAGWTDGDEITGNELTNVSSDRVLTATYTASLRKYTLRYESKGANNTSIVVQESQGEFGDNILFTGEIPTYTTEEPFKFYLFNRWDQSGILDGNFVDGVKTVMAVFDEFVYSDRYFDNKRFEELSPVEIYALTKLAELKKVTLVRDEESVGVCMINDKYPITFGYDVDYDDIESELIVAEPMKFTGNNHYDTGIKLFDEDRDFVLAIDYKMSANNSTYNTLAQCLQSNDSIGFNLWYNSGVAFNWGGSAGCTPARANEREMIVIRHKKGDKNLTIYNSKLDLIEQPEPIELKQNKDFITDSTLVFGCIKSDDGEFSNHAIGDINWCKVWYKDLGDDACRKLASWTHEQVTMSVSDVNRYYMISNPSRRACFSFFADHLMDRIRPFNTSGSNAGGWAASDLNEFLNTRLYNAVPDQLKLLMKQVKVASSVGGMSYEISNSSCYFYLPALAEMTASLPSPDNSNPGAPYISEVPNGAKSIATDDTSRQRKHRDGALDSYWLRSPNITNNTYVYQIDAQGELYAYKQANNAAGIMIGFSI